MRWWNSRTRKNCNRRENPAGRESAEKTRRRVASGRARGRVSYHLADAGFGRRQILLICDSKLRGLFYARFRVRQPCPSGHNSRKIQVAARDVGTQATGRIHQGFPRRIPCGRFE